MIDLLTVQFLCRRVIMEPREPIHTASAEDEFTPEELAHLHDLYVERHRNPPTEEDFDRGRQRIVELLGENFEDGDDDC
jgi:hypothetical protein